MFYHCCLELPVRVVIRSSGYWLITVLKFKFCIDKAPYCQPSVWGEGALSPLLCSSTWLGRPPPFFYKVAEPWCMSTGRWDRRAGRCLDCRQEYFRKEAMAEIDCLSMC